MPLNQICPNQNVSVAICKTILRELSVKKMELLSKKKIGYIESVDILVKCEN